ncbi:unnamed protein product [Lepeophtheirus salmonis]|uniref:(salmon louse) hypothetical protein n=1 Tax=Lepeophtheirus salmonis TaxID=72036 RepID=A0A7R8CLK8_LEPSM|nr:unnamed protein product [Lepeophtheirus salmonis]CAF2859191.1 unnamed protein product [Lepeophtheirus salmonis]
MNSLMKATWIPSRGLKSIPFIKPYYPPRKGTMRSEWRSQTKSCSTHSDHGNYPKISIYKKEAIRCDPSDDHPPIRSPQYPRSSTIIMNPESKRKFKGVRTKHSPFDDNTGKVDE